MPGSVRTRITFVATAMVAIALAAASVLIVRLVEADLITTTERALEAELELEAATFGFGDELQVFDFMVQGRPLSLGVFTEAEEGVAFGGLFEGEVFIGDIFIDLETAEVIEVIDPMTGFPILDPSLIAGLEEVALDFQDVDGDDGPNLLVGAAARDEVNESLTAVQDALTLIVPALVLAMGVLIWFLVGRALRPVQAMSERVDAISTTSLDQRVPVPAGSDEISNLAQVMNRMLDRLQRGDNRQRQFAADASHELRSPLSTVRAAAELIEHNPSSLRTPALAADIVAEAERMDHLIGDLLHLSRVDEEQADAVTERIDLGQLAADNAGGATVTSVPGLCVDGSADHLARLVQNLVANARRHASQNVVVSTSRFDSTTLELRVDDDGAGVADADRDAIFERFSRLDEARSRDQGGAGLGLALVRAIAARHHGHVHVETSPTLGGASFVVRLPEAAGATTPD